jgi:hypothetical protein
MNSSSTNVFLMKLFFNGKTKRCSLPQTYKDLTFLVTRSFPFEELEDGLYDISYMDEDNDYILIENEFDWVSAINFLKGSGRTLLKVIVIQKLDKTLSENMFVFIENKSNSKYKDIELQQSPQLQVNLIHEKIEIQNDHKMEKMDKTEKFRDLKKNESCRTDTLNNISTDSLINKNSENIFNYPKLDLYLEFKNEFLKTSMKLLPCSSCGRKFNESSQMRHQIICQKIKSLVNKRSPFISKKQRIINLEHFILMRRSLSEQVCKERLGPIINPFRYFFCNNSDKKLYKIGNKTNWRNKSNQLRNSIKILKLLKNN